MITESEVLSPNLGDRSFDDLFSLVYEELRALASKVRRRDAGATVSSTGLVHEAWMRLRETPALGCKSPEHFKAIAARAMRQILVDAARRRHAGKRGGTDVIFVPYSDLLDQPISSGEQLLAIDLALDELQKYSAEQALIVEYQFYGGMTVAETASLLGISQSSVERGWKGAKAWLRVRLVAAKG